MIRRLIRDRQAISVVEFAICLPFLATLYLGGYQLSDAISAYRKVTTATRAVADLTTQSQAVNNVGLDTILDASTQVIKPYDVANAVVVVSQIKIDAAGNSTVDWSRAKNGNALAAGTAFAIPSSIRTPSSYLIVASVNYNYVPVVASSLIGNIPMKDQIIMSPRLSTSVNYTP